MEVSFNMCIFTARELRSQLENWLSAAGPSEHGPARAIIAPYETHLTYFERLTILLAIRHAGYQYCGACAAYAYREINPSLV